MHRGIDDVMQDLRGSANDYDFVFKFCAVTVIRFPIARVENLPQREGNVGII